MCITELKKTTIIDRTLPEVYSQYTKLSRLDILSICWLIKDIGVDVIEINSEIAEIIKRVPEGISFLCRIQELSEVKILNKYGIDSFIIENNGFRIASLAGREMQNVKLSMEYNVNELREIQKIINSDILKHSNINSIIRVKGLQGIPLHTFINSIRVILKTTEKLIDVCPYGESNDLNSYALVAINNGVKVITGTINGYARVNKYSSINDILLTNNQHIKTDKYYALKQLENMLSQLISNLSNV